MVAHREADEDHRHRLGVGDLAGQFARNELAQHGQVQKCFIVNQVTFATVSAIAPVVAESAAGTPSANRSSKRCHPHCRKGCCDAMAYSYIIIKSVHIIIS